MILTVYCKFALKIEDDMDVVKVLTQFAIDNFGAREAVPIDAYQFNIDNGMNDVRAVIKEEQRLIAFCCRYKKDVARIEKLTVAFAQSCALEFTTLVM